MNLATTVRRATAADVPVLAALYADTARTLGGEVYTPEQVAAWSSFGADTPAFHDYVLGSCTWVAQRQDSADGDATVVLGFCGIDGQGQVHSLYVRADHCRRGLGTALLTHALADARERGTKHFSAWATPFSEPLFLRAGLVVVDRPLSSFAGVSFRRCWMVAPAA